MKTLPFSMFAKEVSDQIACMGKDNLNLFLVDYDRSSIWETYLAAFPEGTNPIYKTRREYDCNCCKSFIRQFGGVVSINKDTYEITTIWDSAAKLEGYYGIVASAMSNYIKSLPIKGFWLSNERKIGTQQSKVLGDDNNVIIWNHFFSAVPSIAYTSDKDIGSKLSELNTNASVLKQSLEELTKDSGEIVSDLIKQNSLYRGSEFQTTIKTFLSCKGIYDGLSPEHKQNYVWLTASIVKAAGRIRSTVIGTLLIDLSEGRDIESAVASFEAKVAPTNYKRTSAPITKRMIDDAKQKIQELDLEDSLYRRHATLNDIPVEHLLHKATNSAKLSIMDELSANKPTTIGIKKIEEISFSDFVEKVLPTVKSVEALVEPKHKNNFVSIIAPTYPSANNLLAWDNKFSWSYRGEVTDSITERVKAAGGDVNAYCRVSLGWSDGDDLDIHAYTPKGHIYFGNKSNGYGKLDIDMNAGYSSNSVDPVENIIWRNKKDLVPGVYTIQVNNFRQDKSSDKGFSVEFFANGKKYTFNHSNHLKVGNTVLVFKFECFEDGTIEIIEKSPIFTTGESAINVWGVTSGLFAKVSSIMLSPNAWGKNPIGNVHAFFTLDGCCSDDKDEARGFYNEFLRPDLIAHRKVFEVLASKTKVEWNPNQLAGLGFSLTKRDHVILKLTGSFNRTIKVVF